MNLDEQKSTYQILWKTFTDAFGRFLYGLKQYVTTSLLVMSTNLDGLTSKVESGQALTDTKYAYRVFEYILIFLFFSKLFAFGIELDEFMEVIQDFLVLILYFIALLAVVAMGKIAKALFFKQVSKRVIESHFLYSFGFLFLPCYLLLYFGLDMLNDVALDGLAKLLVGGSTVFFWTYYYKMCKTLDMSTIKAITTSFLVAVVMAIFLFLALSLVVGAGYLED